MVKPHIETGIRLRTESAASQNDDIVSGFAPEFF